MKRNIRRIPEDILAKTKVIDCDEIVVGCAVKFKAPDLTAGRLSHLGIVLSETGLHVKPSFLPPADRGRYSSQNIEGEVIVRKDLPKETGYNAIESPNWGKSYSGTHTVYLPFEHYPREFRPPRELVIAITCKDIRPNLPAYIIAFRVEEVLFKKHKDFMSTLFEDLNLLQENVGMCGVEPAQASLSDYTKSLHVSWDILPPGTRDEAIERLFKGRAPTQQEKDTAGERHDFFMSLKPKNLICGNSGFRRYFGALLEENLVVFENVQYGNAIYVLFHNWEELSKRSRLDLLSGKYGTDFKRIIHGSDWKKQVRSIVAEKRDEAITKK
jgi:hypothetical protein